MVIIFISSLCNLAIEISRPYNPYSPINGFLYMGLMNAYVFSDAVVSKSRYFILGMGILTLSLSIYNVYTRTFADIDDTVLLRYTIQAKELTIMKRATQRSI